MSGVHGWKVLLPSLSGSHQEAVPGAPDHPVSKNFIRLEVSTMFELICIGFVGLFLGVLGVCCVMGATKLKREQEEHEYQQRLHERMEEVLEGEPT